MIQCLKFDNPIVEMENEGPSEQRQTLGFIYVIDPKTRGMDKKIQGNSTHIANSNGN